MPSPEVHQFTHGLLNPVAAFILAFGGSLLAIGATTKARGRTGAARRASWLFLASITLGGSIWLMHFIAMLGFDVPASPVRYDLALTAGSALVAVLVVGVGIFAVGFGRRSAGKLLLGGLFTGTGVAVMHYTGMAAMRLGGSIGYNGSIVAASVLVAVVAATVALWFSTVLKGWMATASGALVMATAVCAMHYTGMAALRVHLTNDTPPANGIDPVLLLLPIIGLALVGLVLAALQAINVQEQTATTERRPMDDSQQPNADAPAQATPHPVSLAEFSAMQQAAKNQPRY